MLKIGFDAKRLFNNFTGLGNYSRSIVEGLNKFYPDNKLFLFTPKTQIKDDTTPFLSEPYFVVKPNTKLRSWWRTSGCTNDIKSNRIDIYHGLSHELPIGIEKTQAKSVVTIHDLIYKTYPNDFSRIDRGIYDFKFKYACNKADKIIAISESTKKDLLFYYNLNPEKIAVSYQTCHAMFKTQLSSSEINKQLLNYNLPENYMLYVGSIIERKNLLGIIKAIDSLPKSISIPLVVVGKGSKYLNTVTEYIQKKKLSQKVIFLTTLHYLHLPALYQRAKLFIYPSQYEGFGIPIIESLWSKTPVITSNLSSLPEAAGPGAFYCNPKEYETIKIGIEKILTDTAYSQSLIDKGYDHIQQFNAENTTNSLMKIYKEIL